MHIASTTARAQKAFLDIGLVSMSVQQERTMDSLLKIFDGELKGLQKDCSSRKYISATNCFLPNLLHSMGLLLSGRRSSRFGSHELLQICTISRYTVQSCSFWSNSFSSRTYSRSWKRFSVEHNLHSIYLHEYVFRNDIYVATAKRTICILPGSSTGLRIISKLIAFHPIVFPWEYRPSRKSSGRIRADVEKRKDF